MRKALWCALVLTAAVSVAAMADWPQFLGPDRNGISAETGLTASWPEGGPKVLWSFPLGIGFAGPSVKDGKVFVLDRTKAPEQDVLRCLDLAAGTEDWNFAYDAPGQYSTPGSRSTPTVDDKHVFTIGPMGHIHCVSRETHKGLWSKHLLNDYGGKLPTWAISQSPLLYKDWVIVAPLSGTVGIVALEKATGKEVWKTPAMGDLSYASPFLTTIDGVDQVVMQTKGRIVAVDARTGERLWTYGAWKCAEPIPSPTPIGDGRFFATGAYGAGSAMFKVARDAEGKFSAETVWKNAKIGAQMHNAILHKGLIYLNGNTNEARDGLVCFDLDGKVKWQTQREPDFERGNLLLADGKLFVAGGTSGMLHMVKPGPDGYNEMAKAKVFAARPMWSPMAIVDGKLLARDNKELKCLLLKDQAGK